MNEMWIYNSAGQPVEKLGEWDRHPAINAAYASIQNLENLLSRIAISGLTDDLVKLHNALQSKLYKRFHEAHCVEIFKKAHVGLTRKEEDMLEAIKVYSRLNRIYHWVA